MLLTMLTREDEAGTSANVDDVVPRVLQNDCPRFLVCVDARSPLESPPRLSFDTAGT